MNKQIITFDANEQSLVKTGGVDKYSSNKVSYIEAHFNLGENWSGYDSIRAVWFNWYECISTVLDTEGICIVPHEVLTRTDKVMVNLVGSISEDDVLTDRLTSYPVLALTVDADAKVCGSNTQPITPSEYEQFVETVKADADRAEEAKDEARVYAGNALSSAQNALISETNASASEDNAKASELNAETYKNQAQTYAQNANNSAISAENAKDEAEDARDTILGMRAEATTLPEGSSATASYNEGVMSFGIPKGDTGARGATGETGATPQLSIGTVTTTTEPSVTITGTAENPVLNFGLVKGDKGDTGEVSLADLSTLLPTDTASGSIASFPDGQSVIPALSVVADIEPIQDLHGYDKPWSGGAGKNKMPPILTQGSASIVVFGQDNSTDFDISLKAGTYTISVQASKNVNFYMQKSTDSGSTHIGNYNVKNATFTLESDADIRIWAYVADRLSVSDISTVQLEQGSTATAYEPYSNICPISGRTEVVTHRTGVNVWDEEWEKGYLDPSTGNNASSNDCIRSKNYNAVLPNTSYYVKVPSGSGVNCKLYFYDENKGFISWVTKLNEAFITPSNARYLRFYMSNRYGTTYNHDISINYPSTDTDYHAFDGNTHTTALGRTVYGGTLDVVSGVLTVDRAMVDLGTLNWTYDSQSNRFYTIMISELVKRPSDNYEVADSICSAYSVTSLNQFWSSTDGKYAISITGAVSIRDSKYTDATAFKTAMDGVQLCYELATPQTYQLTPTEVQTLLGQNNIWADTGDVEVTYKADVTKWVEKHLS